MRLILAGTVGALLVGTVVGGCRYTNPPGADGSAGGSTPTDAGSGGLGAGGTGTDGGDGTGAGGHSGSGGAVVGEGGAEAGGAAGGAGGTVTGMGGAVGTGTGGAAIPSGGAGGISSAGGTTGVCTPQPSVVGTWIEVPAPAGASGLVARDAFAASVDDLYFAGRITPPSGSTSMQVLHYSHGCWTVEFTAALATNQSEPSVHGLPTGELWAAGGDQIYRRRGAQDWTPIDSSWHGKIDTSARTPLALTRVRAAASDDLWATEIDNILHYTGGAWTVTNLDDPYYPSQSASIAYRYHDIWIDSPGSVWIAGGSDEVGSTMDPAYLHHFDGTSWSQVYVAKYDALALWHVGSTFWLAAPGQLASNGVQTLVRYDGTGPAMAVPITGASNNGSINLSRLWGRGANDLWAAGNDLVHFDGTDWTLVGDAPPSARVSGYVLDNTFVTGDASAVWVVTPGPRFFRKQTAP